MTQFLSPGRAANAVPPQGEEIASFATYLEAQHAVDSLSDQGFQVEVLTIVGTDLRQVERVTGRMSWGKALLNGMLNGLWLGLFFAMIMSFASSVGEAEQSLSFIVYVLLGVIWGALFQLIGYAATRGRRDFTSTSQVVASRYSILAREYARDAAQELAQAPGNLTRGGEAAARAERRRAAAQAEGPSTFGSRPEEAPKYGVRVPEGTDLTQYGATISSTDESEIPEETAQDKD